jgi:aspartate/methionine/tyrosine aminotransferase
MQIADRMNAIPFSGIRKMFEQVQRKEAQGETIIHLEIGRPDFATPERIRNAAAAALAAGRIHYTSNYGIPELRQAVAGTWPADGGPRPDPETEIIVTAGANEGVFIAMMGLLNPGDEVLVPDPCWPTYYACAHMAGAVPVPVPVREADGFEPRVEELRSRLTPRTRMLIVNTPNNPTGAVYGRETLEALGQFAAEHDLYVLSDEIYEKIIYEGLRHVSVAQLPGMRQRTIVVNGFSKIYSMTGWRLGWVIADPERIGAMIRIHQNTMACATSFAQWGGVEALTGPQGEAEAMVREFARRRDLVCSALKQMPRVHAVTPGGAFYVLVNVKALGKSAEEIAGHLLETAKIAVVPGTSFGRFGQDVVRLSYSTSYENLAVAMERMAESFKRLP